MDLLSACQALTVYIIILALYPMSAPSTAPQKRLSIFSIQTISTRLCQTGLIDRDEIINARPTWEAWVLVATKRRVVFALYAIECVFCDTNKIPRHDCHDLDFMPAPSSKTLWQGRNMNEWEWCKLYERQMEKWAGRGGLQMSDFLPKDKTREDEERYVMWLEEADEFGMMALGVGESLFEPIVEIPVANELITVDAIPQGTRDRSQILTFQFDGYSLRPPPR
jgi:hypothetical protein